MPFAEGRHTAGDGPWGAETKLSASMTHGTKTSTAALQPPGPQWQGTCPLGRKRRFTQHGSPHIAEAPEKAFKCLFFKVVSEAEEKLSEIHNEELNPVSQQRGERNHKRENSGRRGLRIWEEKCRGW